MKFPRMVRPMEEASIGLSLEQIPVHIGNKVLLKVDDNIPLMVGNPPGILDQQFRPHPINWLNINSIK